MTDHPYCYPGTNVYRNKLDLRDPAPLEAAERTLSARRLETLSHNLPITPAGYREIHRYMLQDLYDWAGQDRWINTGRTGPFCRAEFIVPELNKRFAAINNEDNLRGLDPSVFAARAAEHLAELNAIHPFLDGNGRVLRAFLDILGKQAGHAVDLARIDPEGWNEASIRSFHKQDFGPLRDLIAGALDQFARPRVSAQYTASIAPDHLGSAGDCSGQHLREAEGEPTQRGELPDRSDEPTQDHGRDRG